MFSGDSRSGRVLSNAIDDVFAAWKDSIATNRPWRSRVSLVAPLKQSTSGGSGAFLASASDGREYWVKPLNNLQGTRVPCTEQIVGRAAMLIGAPCCAVESVFIPRSIAGWEFRPNVRVERGFAHASAALGAVVEQGGLPGERAADHNSVRHAGYLALYDWCWGGDPQGLLTLAENRAYYSHDHGWFLPPEGPSWDEAALRASVEAAHELGGDDSGIDRAEVTRLISVLERMRRHDILSVVSSIPRSWPVTNEELECVGAFLECRSARVAQRLRVRFGV